MYSFKEIQEIVENQLSGMQIIKEPEQLYRPIQYTMESGGKRVRPAFVLMGCNLFRDNITDAYYPAIALEMFHNFTLLHDDIMDNSAMRRGKSTVHEKWGSNSAILSGDAMSIKAYELLSEYTGDNFRELIWLFNKTALDVCEGQQMDMDFENMKIVSEDEYLKMIELKTAALLAGSLKMGALIGGADENNAQHLYEFGKFLGLSFQLQDDYLDLFGDPKIFGKKIGGDIVSNKKTYLLIKSLERAGKEDRKKIQALMETTDYKPEEKISRAKAFFDKYEVANRTAEKIKEYNELAKRHFENVKIEEKRKQPLLEVAGMLMNREK